MKRLLLSLALIGLGARPTLAQDGASCDAGQPANGLTELGQALQTMAAPQSFDIGNATRVRAQDLRGQGELQATCYDDGASCPGGCDEHVVANNATNGTARFHAPGSTPGAWQDCRSGQDCEVCFGDDPADCLTVTYRGTGPDAGRADFTASFWEELCAVEDLPETLDDECDRIDAGSDALRAISCLEDPSAAGCEGLVPNAQERAAAQQAVADCLAERDGSWRCYYQGPGGTLSPGACENGAVNSSGWDCCSGDAFHDACVTGCGGYYVDAAEGGDTGAVAAPERVEPAELEEPPPVAEPAVAEPVPTEGDRPPLPPRWRPLRRRPGPRR
jgi:hypothetical protein